MSTRQFFSTQRSIKTWGSWPPDAVGAESSARSSIDLKGMVSG